MKVKVIGWIVIASYILGIYGLNDVGHLLSIVAMTLPIIACVVYLPLAVLFDFLGLSGKDKIDGYTNMYIAFVLSTFGLLFFCRELDFMIGRFIMLFGATLFYLGMYTEEKAKRDKEIEERFYWDIKCGRRNAPDLLGN